MDLQCLRKYCYDHVRPSVSSFDPRSLQINLAPLPEVTALSVEQLFPAEALDEYRRSTPGTMERYQTVRRLLKSMVSSGSDGTEVNHWNDRVIRLPNINILDSYDTNRFAFQDGFISMVNRDEWCSKAIQFVNQHQVSYVYGTKGIGKSFAIYQVAARLMADDNYRVVFINNANVDIMVDFFRTLKLILHADKELFTLNNEPERFAEALEQLKQMNKKLNSFSKKEELNAVNICLKHAYEFYSQKNIKLLFVVDQTNNLMYPQFLDEKVFCAKALAPCGRVLLGGSANNEYEDLDQDSNSYLSLPLSFTKQEFDAYRFLEPTTQAIVTNEERRRLVMSITGGLPIELRRFFTVNIDGKEEDFSRRLLEYTHDFNFEYTFSRLHMYCDKFRYDRKGIGSFIENLFCLVFQLPIAPDDTNYDKRVISAFEKDGNKYLKPINYLARDTIIAAFDLSEAFTRRFNELYRVQFLNHSAPESCVKSFVSKAFALGDSRFSLCFDIFDFQIQKIGRFALHEFDVVRLDNQLSPDILKPRFKKPNTLFLPPENGFHLYDFYYCYVPELKPGEQQVKPVLFCFQITNEKDAFEKVSAHHNKFSTPDLLEYVICPSIAQMHLDDADSSDEAPIEMDQETSVFSGDSTIQSLIDLFGPDVTFYEIWIINRTYWQEAFQRHASNPLVQNMNIAFFQDIYFLKKACFLD